MNPFSIFFSPSDTIARSKTKTNIIIPLILSCILVILPILLCSEEYLAYTIATMEKYIESSGITNEFQINMIMQSISETSVMTYIGSIVSTIITVFVSALIFYFIGSMFGGQANSKFKNYLSVSSCVTFICILITSVATIIVAKTTGIYETDLSLNVFMPIITRKTPYLLKFFFLFLQGASITQIWSIFIWGMTLKEFANLKKFTAYGISIIIGIVVILINIFPQL